MPACSNFLKWAVDTDCENIDSFLNIFTDIEPEWFKITFMVPEMVPV